MRFYSWVHPLNRRVCIHTAEHKPPSKKHQPETIRNKLGIPLSVTVTPIFVFASCCISHNLLVCQQRCTRNCSAKHYFLSGLIWAISSSPRFPKINFCSDTLDTVRGRVLSDFYLLWKHTENCLLTFKNSTISKKTLDGVRTKLCKMYGCEISISRRRISPDARFLFSPCKCSNSAPNETLSFLLTHSLTKWRIKEIYAEVVKEYRIFHSFFTGNKRETWRRKMLCTSVLVIIVIIQLLSI